MLTPTEQDVMKACGENGIRAMVAAFYGRVRHDELIGPMYPADDWEGSEERLADFMLFRLGASDAYMEKRGHPRLRMRHMQFRIGVAGRNWWMQTMVGALEDAAIPEPERSEMVKYFEHAATFLINAE